MVDTGDVNHNGSSAVVKWVGHNKLKRTEAPARTSAQKEISPVFSSVNIPLTKSFVWRINVLTEGGEWGQNAANDNQ